MPTITLIAYEAMVEDHISYQVRKTKPFDVLNRFNVMVHNLDDIEHEVEQFGKETSAKHPTASFAINIMFAHGERKLRGFDKASKEKKFAMDQWMKVVPC